MQILLCAGGVAGWWAGWWAGWLAGCTFLVSLCSPLVTGTVIGSPETILT